MPHHRLKDLPFAREQGFELLNDVLLHAGLSHGSIVERVFFVQMPSEVQERGTQRITTWPTTVVPLKEWIARILSLIAQSRAIDRARWHDEACFGVAIAEKIQT